MTFGKRNGYSTIPTDTEQEPLFVTDSKPRIDWGRVLKIVLAGVVGASVITAAIFLLTGQETSLPKRNMIMMISDGFGPASETYARQYHSWREGLPPKSLLPLDHIHVGHSRTQSSSSLVTDSAAGATAFACGLKSYNGAIGVNPSKEPCGTVLESAKLHREMLTGLVVTSRITHATPGAFSAHVTSRDDENHIAEQQIGYNPLGRTVDLMFGGGVCEFLSNTTAGSCRADNRDLFAEAKDNFGWTVKLSRDEFDKIKPSDELPLMALFASGHMNYEIDRNPVEQPSLKEMVSKALDILTEQSKKADKGFFLMIEGSRIDMAAHTNDPAAHFYDIYEYHQTAQLVLDYVKNHPDTVMISTSDHETGGLTVGRQVTDEYPEYKWNPEVISRVRNSSEALARAWSKVVQKEDIDTANYLKSKIIDDGLGIKDATDEEINSMLSWKDSGKDITDLENRLAGLVNRRALIGFTTHGHSAVDVNLYAYGPGTEALRGSHENTEIGDFIVDYLQLDIQDVTKRLKADTPIVMESTEEAKISRHQLYYD